MKIFYNRRNIRKYALMFLMIMGFNLFFPTVSWALTSGPSQPEVQSFEPASTTQMVDLFSGDFTYNIPLFELPGPNGGYPFNLAYHAGIGMDQEASWVGLGWNLNPGAINRQMRGLPDEFKGDLITTKSAMKSNWTLGVGMGVSGEVFGFDVFSADLTVYNNTYKGVGFTLGAGVSQTMASMGPFTSGLGLDFSLDSQGGVGVNPSLSLTSEFLKGDSESAVWKKNARSLSLGYNSMAGLQSLTFGSSRTSAKYVGFRPSKVRHVGLSGSSTLSLANPGFTPTIGHPMTNNSVNLSFKVGGSWWGLFPNAEFSGFYNEQKMKYNGKERKTKAYGYLNYQHYENDGSLMDFNREQDGTVREENPNLPIPSLTYDIYSATAQGYAAMYRPFRSDVGVIHDPKTESGSNAFSAGGDVGPALSHVGVNASLNHSKSTSGKWEDNSLEGYYDFQKKATDDIYEPWYFKVHGEPTVTSVENLDEIGGEDPVRVRIDKPKSDPVASRTLEKDRNWTGSVVSNQSKRDARTPRNSAIMPITVDELMNDDSDEVIDLFKIQYYNSSGNLRDYSRQQLMADKGHHIAGFTALTPEGNRYVYGLPAYNLKHQEYTFSTPKVDGQVRADIQGSGENPKYDYSGTDKFLNKKEIPEYAHSYLLTAIVGQDYVDVTGDGVSSDDLGYWVKFSYQQVTDAYKWRAPFYQASYHAGLKTTAEDDRASFTYGEKEVWYLKRAETKSHIAEFSISNDERTDGRGANTVIQNDNSLGEKSYRLDEIILYTRLAGNAVPLKKVKFAYSQELCSGVDNGTEGKLTLKNLWFEYGNNSRGSLNPYTFDYSDFNPSYDINAYDRWGNYKPAGTDPLQNQEYPYVDPYTQREEHDKNAAVWSLKKIALPSGGTIEVDYEADDYAYVQDRQAMQMLELVDPFNTPGNNDFQLNDDNTKIKFKLPRPLKKSDISNGEEELKKFLESDREMLYFKLKTNLRSPSEDQFDFLGTYAEIDRAQEMGLEGDGDEYEYGYFHLKKEEGYNPLLLRAWQHLRVNQPTLASLSGKVDGDETEFGEALRSLASIIPKVHQMLTGFYDYANNKSWGRELDAGKCWVRLLDPEKKRVGGGHRVKQITYYDNWADNEGIYGQVYDYTTQDEEGNTISSGVATYEPMIGGDENPVRYARKFSQSIPLLSDNQLFFQYPINEGYYPGPSVGYSKVIVMSLASAVAARIPVLHNDRGGGNVIFPEEDGKNFGTTGKSVNEFYTAKDFPVITDETVKTDLPYKLWIPAVPIGTISAKKLASSQGYSIITNNMHGKPRRVSHFAQGIDGVFGETEFSYVEYKYFQGNDDTEERNPRGTLNNIFVDNGDGTLSKADAANGGNKVHMGQETEFFVDIREHRDESYTGGLNYNTDVFMIPILFGLIPIPVPSVWPNASANETLLRTVVTNKVIFKTGILESITASNDGSIIHTKNLKWDKLTGRAILTQVNNNFDEPVYNLSIPAHTQYAGMGAAYQNIGYTCSLTGLEGVTNYDHYFSAIISSYTEGILQEGDEVILMQDGQTKGKAVYTGDGSGEHWFYSKDALAAGDYEAMIYRSARRNLLTVDAGQVTALKDPTAPVGTKTYNVEVLK